MDWTVILTCGLIVVGRIVDVSLGTLRTVMVVTGRRGMAFILGFCEVLIWITVVGQLIANLDHWTYYPAYALGFALGCFVGMTIERRLPRTFRGVRRRGRKPREVAAFQGWWV